ncbi:MAG: MarR family transcriptional regulator [Candidatus Omnitrophota bacterium]
MEELKLYGVDVEQSKNGEEIIYGAALIYNIINNKIFSYLKDYNLTPGKFNILVVVKHRGGEEGIKQVGISKHLIVTPSNMTKLIDKLEAEKFVTRFSLEGDRRVNVIKITKKGADLLDKVWNGYNAALGELLKGLNRAQKKTLSSLLLKWFESLRKGRAE